MKVVNSLLRFKIIQDIFDPDRDICVAGVVESRQQHRGVFVDLEHVVKRLPPFLQLMKPNWKRATVKTVQTQFGPGDKKPTADFY